MKDWATPAPAFGGFGDFVWDVAQARAGAPELVGGADDDDGDVFGVEVASPGHVGSELDRVYGGEGFLQEPGGFSEPFRAFF